ncbi:hypothetical protein JG688_00002420 [Phytophthora aleatoria]|uniref:Transmembrane protein n=1 Tax=Phytophthora aleatoria TaxID=2496075 RepID=A0A8J5J0T2_9STRA|nr:hypothetical protein JG688_00002420 [Phytophthora aleatoria]
MHWYQLNEVLHLDAFTVSNVQITEDYTFLHFLEEVDFHLTYTIETPNPDSNVNPNSSYFNALLLNEYEYAHYVDGEPFEYIAAGSKLRTTYAYLPNTYIDNTIKETMYFVVQPCYLERNPTADYCNTTQLPTSVSSSEKIYNLDQKKKMKVRLSRGERALIVVCSLYVTFYVLFIIVMLRDSYGSSITILTSVVMYAVLTSILPSAGKAIFKELFKLIFRQRRKYFRAKAAGGDLTGFSFRLAFLLQVLVAVLLTLAQAPIFYIWAKRSCLFLKKFIYYGVLSAILRMSLMGVALDFACTREKKILELNSKIELDAFEKHYDSNISDVFRALTHSVMKHRRHERQMHRRHPTEDQSSQDERQISDGETMWVFDTPEQRLQRREEERLQRKRAFRVLNDYDIENVDPSPATMACQGSVNRPSSKVSHQDPKGMPLLSARNNDTASRDEEVVVQIPDDENLDGLVAAQVVDDYSDGSEYSSNMERRSIRSHSLSSAHQAYTVTEKPKSLLRRVSASATAFAAWCLDYDPEVKY